MRPYRGGCTDPNWSDEDACPSMCNDFYEKRTAVLFPCPANADGEWKWWCGDTTGGRTCHEADTSTFFFWKNGPIDHIAGASPPVSSAVTSDASLSTSTSTSTPTSSTGSNLPTTVNPSSNPSPTPDPENKNNNSSSSDDGDMVKKSTPIAVGLGVGVPLVLVAAFLGVMYYRERAARVRVEQSAALLRGGGAEFKYQYGAGEGTMRLNEPMELPASVVHEMRS
ncbi:hypothetical protein FQN53_000928 [Emmonsiellopsis sp. PD_33]|nr:hypothetical protein FQN53_000928 [Emmonsiellopsis sp. PD_33]